MKAIARGNLLAFAFFIAVLLIAGFPPQMLAISAGETPSLPTSDSTKEESALSEEDTEKALDIIHGAGGGGLTESDKARLLGLGLTEEQIQMLQGLSGEPGNTAEGSDNWVEKEIKWYDKPAVLFTLLGVMIAGVMIVLIWVSRTLLFHNSQQKRNRRIKKCG